MKVKEIMTSELSVCDLNASLAEAAKVMWNKDCGILPVLKDGKELVGLITDRDICMGIAMRDRVPSGVSVEEVMTGKVYSVMSDDDVQQALETMRQHKVRRLPVVDAEGKLTGMLSLNDVTLRAEKPANNRASSLSLRDVMKTYKAICTHQIPAETGEKIIGASA
jgi:CBS-domain-containing membrane protein